MPRERLDVPGSKAGERRLPNLFTIELISSYAPGAIHEGTRSGVFHVSLV